MPQYRSCPAHSKVFHIQKKASSKHFSMIRQAGHAAIAMVLQSTSFPANGWVGSEPCHSITFDVIVDGAGRIREVAPKMLR